MIRCKETLLLLYDNVVGLAGITEVLSEGWHTQKRQRKAECRADDSDVIRIVLTCELHGASGVHRLCQNPPLTIGN
jgi:hypothetical protein